MPGIRVTRGEAVLLGSSISVSALGQVCLRVGASASGADGAARTVVAALGHPAVLAGLGLYAVGALLWLLALSRVDLSVAYPMGASSYLIVAVAGAMMGESVTPMRLGGMAVIALGVVLLGSGGRR